MYRKHVVSSVRSLENSKQFMVDGRVNGATVESERSERQIVIVRTDREAETHFHDHLYRCSICCCAMTEQAVDFSFSAMLLYSTLYALYRSFARYLPCTRTFYR